MPPSVKNHVNRPWCHPEMLDPLFIRPGRFVVKSNVEKQRKSLSRRPSNVVSLVRDKSNLSDEGTALFIAATLLQREMVETLVPIQAAGIISILYILDIKSNSIVGDWTNTEWIQS